MMLNKTTQQVFEFVRRPRTAEQVAEHLGLSMSSVYRPLRLLQRLDLVEKTVSAVNLKATYMAVKGADPYKAIPMVIASSGGYIKAHDPFNLGAGA